MAVLLLALLPLTIAFGTAAGHVAVKNETVPVPVDGDMMKMVAQFSGGQTSTAETIDELDKKFSAVEDQMGFQMERGSASAGWLRLAVIVAGVGAALALLINAPNRIHAALASPGIVSYPMMRCRVAYTMLS